MAQVSVTIDNKAYRMACEEGQEDHLVTLAERFDRYVSHLKSQFGEIGDLRITVMAAIMVMDELAEKERTMRALQGEVEALRKTRDAAVARSERSDESLVGTIGEITAQIERLSSKLTAHPPAN
ncbi:cell division protein ZapA [Pararhizobium haloflavum]|uniref:cell division protein ZapA n=1 Tax=Pararhizobium haloflavum TaxID=2037914 RepID=UPI000C184D28|nr:cell division protein ZapA [Pararhizobium haloflavum]